MKQPSEETITIVGLVVLLGLLIILPPWQEWFTEWAKAVAYSRGLRL